MASASMMINPISAADRRWSPSSSPSSDRLFIGVHKKRSQEHSVGGPPRATDQIGKWCLRRIDSSVNPIRMVLNGGFPPGTAGNPMPYGMPPFAQTLSDDEVAAVVTYIRAAWGNRGSAVSARQANELRTAPLD
jgi:hypothetical protein